MDTIKFDYIVIPGDLFDSYNHVNNKDITDLLIEYGNKYKIIISIGNHDIIDPKTRELNDNISLKKLARSNCILLDNDSYIDDNISFYGFNPSIDWYYNGEKSAEYNSQFNNNMKVMKDNNLKILLSHSPNGLINKGNLVLDGDLSLFNLILCGHNHAGLMPYWLQKKLKKRFALIGPYNKIFMIDAYGYYKRNNNVLLMSNGVTLIADSGPFDKLSKHLTKLFLPNIYEIDLVDGKEYQFELKSDNREEI